jgi:hypothetical protein
VSSLRGEITNVRADITDRYTWEHACVLGHFVAPEIILSARRLTTPLVARDGFLTPVGWEEVPPISSGQNPAIIVFPEVGDAALTHLLGRLESEGRATLVPSHEFPQLSSATIQAAPAVVFLGDPVAHETGEGALGDTRPYCIGYWDSKGTQRMDVLLPALLLWEMDAALVDARGEFTVAPKALQGPEKAQSPTYILAQLFGVDPAETLDQPHAFTPEDLVLTVEVAKRTLPAAPHTYWNYDLRDLCPNYAIHINYKLSTEEDHRNA